MGGLELVSQWPPLVEVSDPGRWRQTRRTRTAFRRGSCVVRCSSGGAAADSRRREQGTSGPDGAHARRV